MKSATKNHNPARLLVSIPSLLQFLFILNHGIWTAYAYDLVYVRSNSFHQLITSSTLRWVRGQDAHAVTLESGEIICRVSQAGLRQIGLLSTETGECNTNTEEDPRIVSSSSNYQTLSGQAARLSWVPWVRPNPPPTAAISISAKVQKFIATPNDGSAVVGFMDPRQSLGSAIFPNSAIPLSTSARILTEVEPERYELYDIDLKKSRDFVEQEIVLARGKLKYETSETRTGSEYEMEYTDDNNGLGDDEESEYEDEYQDQEKNKNFANSQRQVYHHIHGVGSDKGRIESVLSYDTESNSRDYWGNGNLMVKGLLTYIQLPEGWSPNTKMIEWGLPVEQPRKTETMTISADLLKETGVSVTIKGTRMDGEMTYWATLKTYYRDGSSATRLIEGVRRLNEVNNIHVVLGRPYFLQNGTLVPEPTTTTTTTTTTTPRPTSSSSSSEASSSARGERDKMFGDGGNTITRADKSTSSFAISVFSFNSSISFYLVTLAAVFSFLRH